MPHDATGISCWYKLSALPPVQAVAGATAGAQAGVIEETLAGAGNFTGKSITASHALDAAEEFLGPGYRQLGKADSGVFRSADGLRQFRMDNGSLLGSHRPFVPHVHFETLDPLGNVLANNHVPFH